MRPFLLAVCLLVLPVSSFANAPYLVSDLSPGRSFLNNSQPVYLATVNGVALFRIETQYSSGNGNTRGAIWRTDGTPGGTYEILALQTGYRLVNVQGVLTSGNTLYLGALSTGGWQVWKTDGTVAGTSAVTPLTTKPVSPAGVTGDRLLFLQESSRELWVTDAAGPRLLVNLQTPETTRWTPSVTIGNQVYVGTDSGLWKSDGTEAGTVKLMTGAARSLTAAGNRLFFFGQDDRGLELWVSDGSQGGTRRVADLTNGAASTFALDRSVMAAFGSRVVFLGSDGELGISDGTSGGTRVLRTGVAPNALPSIAVLNSVAFLSFNDGIHGMELWRTDGTEGGTLLVRDSSNDPAARVAALTAGATRVYYYGHDRERGHELFTSDGTEAGTRVAHERRGTSWLGSYPAAAQTIVTIGDAAFFVASDRDTGAEPWISDGSDAGTRRLANIGKDEPIHTSPYSFMAGDDVVFFEAQYGGHWRSDGTAAGTQHLPVKSPTGADGLIANGNTWFLRDYAQLWKTGITPGSAALVKDFSQHFNTPSVHGEAVVYRGKVLVIADDGESSEVYATDGTAAGTTRLTNRFAPPSSFTMLAGRLHFLAGSATLFTTDGTPAGTRSIAGVELLRRSRTYAAAGSLFLFGNVRDEPNALWKFGGDVREVVKVKELPGGGEEIAVGLGDILLFAVKVPEDSFRNFYTLQLWRSDGTPDGTVMVKQIGTHVTYQTATNCVAFGRGILCSFNDGLHGAEPWVSDGTEAGTFMLRDIEGSVTRGSEPLSFAVVDGLAYFSAWDVAHGRELWQTDGTSNGTVLLADINPGPENGGGMGMTRVRDLLFFSGTTENEGSELWAYPLPEISAVTIDDARAAEHEGRVIVPVRLTRPSKSRVTVSYATEDETAVAGRDYTAAAGTVVFEPGETRKDLAIAIADDNALSGTRVFYVRLKEANAPFDRGVAAAILEEDDRRVDLRLSFSTGPTNGTRLTLRNDGPSPASNVRICFARAAVQQLAPSCSAPFQMAAGEVQTYDAEDMVGATVTQWEMDSNPANGTISWIATPRSGYLSMAVVPAAPRVGEPSTLFIYSSGNVELLSSNPAVLTVPSQVAIPSETWATVPFTPAGPGSVTITAKRGPNASQQAKIVLQVAGPGDPLRVPIAVRFYAPFSWTFGVPGELSAFLDGMRPDGAIPTGAVSFFDGTAFLGTSSVTAKRATLTVGRLRPGTHTVTAVYSGDANFLPIAPESGTLQVQRGSAFISAGTDGETPDVRIRVRGVEGFPPTGTVTVEEAGGIVRTVTGPLAAIGGDVSATTATGFSATARTVKVTYSGDANYEPVTVTTVIAGPKRRASRH
jgi:ELWxxDGT repeat protein